MEEGLAVGRPSIPSDLRSSC